MINLEYLNKTLGDNELGQKKILKLFLNQLPNFSKDLQLHYSNSDFSAIRALAHKTKNSFGILGAKEQVKILTNIETLAKQEDNTDILSELITQIISDSEKICTEIENLCA